MFAVWLFGALSIVDILAKVLYFQKLPKILGRGTKIWGCRDRIYAQNFDAVLAVIVILAGEAIFGKFDWKCRKRIKLHNSDLF